MISDNIFLSKTIPVSKVWIQGVITDMSTWGSAPALTIDDGTQVILIANVPSPINQRNLVIGDYVMIIGVATFTTPKLQLDCGDGHTRFESVHIEATSVMHVDNDPNLESLWMTEVIISQKQQKKQST